MQYLKTVSRTILTIYNNNKMIFTAGNGGSSANASHLTNDLIKGCAVYGRTGIKSVCLTDSSTVLTCLSNDFSYEDALMKYLKNLGSCGDCLVVFSGSGNSENLVRAAQYAQDVGITVIGFLGANGGNLKKHCDYYLLAPADNMEEIEDLHLKYIHQLKQLLIEQLQNSFGIEIIKYPHPHFNYAIFDFDGTISLIRQGWQEVMIPYFVEILLNTPKGKEKSYIEIQNIVKDFVDRLTGKKTLFQCIALNEWVIKFGGKDLDPLLYKKEYLNRLLNRIRNRHIILEQDHSKQGDFLINGIKDFLVQLKECGIKLYCASGTDEEAVKYEAHLLGIDMLFEDNIYGARDDQGLEEPKEYVIKNLIFQNNLLGTELLVFGDGMIEIELCKKVGGYAIGVASDEINRTLIDIWKRERLTKSGADIIIPNFSNPNKLVEFLGIKEK